MGPYGYASRTHGMISAERRSGDRKRTPDLYRKSVAAVATVVGVNVS